MARLILRTALMVTALAAAAGLQGCKRGGVDLDTALSTSKTSVDVKQKAVTTASVRASANNASKSSAKNGNKATAASNDTPSLKAVAQSRPKPLAPKKPDLKPMVAGSYGALLDTKAKTGAVPLQRSARCRQILAAAGLDATMLRSPTLSATIDQDGKGALSLGYDVLDLRRARMKVELAQLQCARYQTSVRLAQLLVTSPQALSRAGYIAKAEFLRRNRSRLFAVKRRVKRQVREGLITIHSSNAIRQRINQVAAQEARTRGEAERREVVDNIQLKSARDVDRKLVAYEERIHTLQKALRKTDAYEVSVSGGYNYDSQEDPFSVDAGRDLYAKLKVGVRLGVLSRQRDDFEQELRAARVEALYEPNTGGLWRAKKMSTANGRLLKNLLVQKREVAAALREARRTVAASRGADDPWLVSSGLRARIDVIALGGDLAGLTATIADVYRLDGKLKFQE